MQDITKVSGSSNSSPQRWIKDATVSWPPGPSNHVVVT